MADSSLVQLLQRGAKEWNDAPRPEFPDLKNAKLHAVRLEGADLRGARLSEADLSGADLSRVNLHGADLRRANLTEAKLYNANLTEARFGYANLTNAVLDGSTMSGYIDGADFSRANLAKANLNHVMGYLASFSDANLAGTSLNQSNFGNASFRRANLEGAHLFETQLGGANLSEANLKGAYLERADLRGANLCKADLTESDLRMAKLSEANLAGAQLRDVNLSQAILVETDVSSSNLSGARVYGCSVWGLRGIPANQENLLVTPESEPPVRVDDLEVAQFIYLLLNNQKLRNVIDSITSKAVLLLGRFGQRKHILEIIRDVLRRRGYLPILFDFDIPQDRDITETIRTLAGLARFIIADLTDPASIPKELEAIVPDLAVPVCPLIEGDQRPFSMFADYWKYPWVIREPFRYENPSHLIENLDQHVIAVAEAKYKEVALLRASGK